LVGSNPYTWQSDFVPFGCSGNWPFSVHLFCADGAWSILVNVSGCCDTADFNPTLAQCDPFIITFATTSGCFPFCCDNEATVTLNLTITL
jgi:hypothetical protein